MLLVISIATLLFLGAFSRQSRLFFIFSFCLLFLFVAFRDYYVSGGDFDAYIYRGYFSLSPTLKTFNWKFWNYYDGSYGFGWGYGLLNAFVKTLTSNYFYFQLVDTILVFFLMAMVLKKTNLSYSEKCFMLFIWLSSKFLWYFFILLRQNISILIVWFVFLDYTPKRKSKFFYIRDLVLIFISYLFHSSAFLIFFVYHCFIFINSKIQSRRIVFFSLIISLLLLGFTSKLYVLFRSALVYIDPNHFGQSYEDKISNISQINIISYVQRCVYLLLIFKYTKSSKKYKNTLSTTSLAVAAGGISNSLVIRIVELFAIGYYVGIAKFMAFLRKKRQFILLMVMYLMYIAMIMQYIIVNNPYLFTYHLFSF